MSSGPRVYKGLARRERAGWIAGLQLGQAVACLALCAPVLIAFSTGHWRGSLGLAAVAVAGVGVVVVPVHGRPALRWLTHLLLYLVGQATGWSVWQSRAATGQTVDPGEPDLPGVLTRVEFPDGPVFRTQGRVCLIHDTAEGRWGATARLTHTGVGMLADAECAGLADRLGGLLLSVAQRDGVDRLSLLVRTVPDDGTEHQVWAAAHQSPDAPAVVRAAAAELNAALGAVAVRHELFLTVSGTEAALRRPAQAAGGGITGRAHALYRALDGIEDGVKALNVSSVSWLSGSGMAEALRTGYNPAAAAALDRDRWTGALTGHPNRHPGGPAGGGLPMGLAGPSAAPSPAARSYTHDGFTTVSYSLVMPTAGTTFGSLGPLLAVRSAGERRCVAIHYEVAGPARSARAVQTDRFRTTVVGDYKTRKGFATSAVDERTAGGARAQERAVAAGHAIVRFAPMAAVTVPSHWNLEDHAARLENDAAAYFRLLRLELAQDSGFVAACLPVGIGLPRLRGSLR